MEQIVTQLTDFYKNCYLYIFRKSVKKIQDSFNLTTITDFQYTLLSYRTQFYYNENVQANVAGEIETHIYIQQLFLKNYPLRNNVKNVVDSDGPHISVWCLHITR